MMDASTRRSSSHDPGDMRDGRRHGMGELVSGSGLGTYPCVAPRRGPGAQPERRDAPRGVGQSSAGGRGAGHDAQQGGRRAEVVRDAPRVGRADKRQRMDSAGRARPIWLDPPSWMYLPHLAIGDGSTVDIATPQSSAAGRAGASGGHGAADISGIRGRGAPPGAIAEGSSHDTVAIRGRDFTPRPVASAAVGNATGSGVARWQGDADQAARDAAEPEAATRNAKKQQRAAPSYDPLAGLSISLAIIKKESTNATAQEGPTTSPRIPRGRAWKLSGGGSATERISGCRRPPRCRPSHSLGAILRRRQSPLLRGTRRQVKSKTALNPAKSAH